MSLIQEALEKARPSKPLMQSPEKTVAPPKVTPEIKKELKPVVNHMPPRWQPALPKIAPDLKEKLPVLKKQSEKLIPAGAYIVLALLAAAIGMAGLLFRSKSSLPEKMAASSFVSTVSMPSQSLKRPKWTLNGITVAEGLRVALINNQIVKVGDRLKDNVLVKEIADRSVTLETQGKETTLNL